MNDRRHDVKSRSHGSRPLHVILVDSRMYSCLLHLLLVLALHERWDREVSGCQTSQESDRYGAV